MTREYKTELLSTMIKLNYQSHGKSSSRIVLENLKLFFESIFIDNLDHLSVGFRFNTLI
jgi:hypothetical protein